MKCRSHPQELGPGVCASCLRYRLLQLLAAQTDRRRSSDHCENLDPLPPLSFPRSVSPYLSYRRHCRRFFSTPQVGPTDLPTRRPNRFSLLRSTTSWISALIRRKKPNSLRSKPFANQERGMSPTDDDDDRSVCSSGYSTESSTGWRLRRPEPTPVRSYGSRSVSSGFAVCLSPLVRPPTAELGIAGDIRGSWRGKKKNKKHNHHQRHVSIGGASLASSGSRKLADYGRFR